MDGEIINSAIHYAEDLCMRKVKVDKNEIPYLADTNYDIGKITIKDLDYGIDAMKANGNMISEWDEKKLLNEKDSPIDRGLETFETLYRNKIRIR